MDAMQQMIANEFRKRIQDVDWRALDWGMKNNKDTGEMTFNITFPGTGAMAQKVLKQKQQQGAPVVEEQPAPEAMPSDNVTQMPTAEMPKAASRKVEVKVAMTQEASRKLTMEKYPDKFLKSMGLA
jgi:hypothetical protein